MLNASKALYKTAAENLRDLVNFDDTHMSAEEAKMAEKMRKQRQNMSGQQ